MAVVYRATNIVNGKSYIGFTNCWLEKRKVEHKCEAGGKPSWNKGKECTQICGNKNGGGNYTRGKTWIKDKITGKRVWL